jgi:hypothetical protein
MIIDKGKPKVSEGNLPLSVHRIHMVSLGLNPDIRLEDAMTDTLSYDTSIHRTDTIIYFY